MIQDKIFPGYQPICKNICVDFGFKIDQNNPYLGLQWLISHNMIIDGKTSVNLNFNDDTDIVTHNIIGAKLILKQTQNILLLHTIKPHPTLKNRPITIRTHNSAQLNSKRLKNTPTQTPSLTQLDPT